MLPPKIDSNSTGVFYYAGHAVRVEGQNYLIPVDGKWKTEDEVKYDNIPLERVLDNMKKAKNNLNIVIMEACRNNPYGENQGLASIRDLSYLDNFIIAYATEPRRTTYKKGKLGQSLSDGDPVWAIGYPIDEQGDGDQDGFVTFKGEVLLQLENPFEKGYLVGTDTLFLKGMSGGPLVNAQGHIVGIGGKLRSPILNLRFNNCDAYIYEDETNVCDDPRA